MREATLRLLEEYLLRTGSWYKANGDTPFIMGDVPIQSDFVVGSCLLWGDDRSGVEGMGQNRGV